MTLTNNSQFLQQCGNNGSYDNVIVKRESNCEEKIFKLLFSILLYRSFW